jgi:hypothetical protein
MSTIEERAAAADKALKEEKTFRTRVINRVLGLIHNRLYEMTDCWTKTRVLVMAPVANRTIPLVSENLRYRVMGEINFT